MGRGLCYSDAVRLLGENSSVTVKALDRLAGGLLLVASVSGHPAVLGLLEAKSEFAQLSQDLVTGLSDRVRGMSRFDRSERLAAAHSVLVVAAYFDALAKVDLPVMAEDLKLNAAGQVTVTAGVRPRSGRLAALADALLRADLPMPSPQSPFEETLESIRDFYASVSAALLDFLTALPSWEGATKAQREAVLDALRDPRADAPASDVRDSGQTDGARPEDGALAEDAWADAGWDEGQKQGARRRDGLLVDVARDDAVELRERKKHGIRRRGCPGLRRT